MIKGVAKTKSRRFDHAGMDAGQSLWELLRTREAINAVIRERLRVLQLHENTCFICGERITSSAKPKKLPKGERLCKLISLYGKDAGRAIWKKKRKELKKLKVHGFTLTSEKGGEIYVRVCSLECESFAQTKLNEARECSRFLMDANSQIGAIRKFLKTGCQDAFQSLPPELGPDRTSLE